MIEVVLRPVASTSSSTLTPQVLAGKGNSRLSAKADKIASWTRPSLLVLILAGLGVSLFGASGADFLLLDISADSMSLGGAVTAGLGSTSDLRHNPAGLANLSKSEAAFTHVSAFGDWNHDWLALAFPTKLGIFAAEGYSSQLTPTPYYDDNGNEDGYINAGSQVVGLAWAGNPTPSRLSVGTNLRFFSSNLAGFSNWGYSGDLGLRWQTKENLFSAGIALKNFGEQTTYYAERETLPTSLNVGICFRDSIQQIGISAWSDGSFYKDPARDLEIRAGFRLNLWQRLDLSAGWRVQGQRYFLCYGGGVDIGFGKIIYAYIPDSLLSATHAITLQVNKFP